MPTQDPLRLKAGIKVYLHIIFLFGISTFMLLKGWDGISEGSVYVTPKYGPSYIANIESHIFSFLVYSVGFFLTGLAGIIYGCYITYAIIFTDLPIRQMTIKSVYTKPEDRPGAVVIPKWLFWAVIIFFITGLIWSART